MTCCDWPTFHDAFLKHWEKKQAGAALIDWPLARRDWKRRGCTGGEAATMQLATLASEAEYLWVQRANEAKLQIATGNRGGRR